MKTERSRQAAQRIRGDFGEDNVNRPMASHLRTFKFGENAQVSVLVTPAAPPSS